MNENIKPLSRETLLEQKVNTLKKMMDEKVLKNHKLYIKINKFGHDIKGKYHDHENYQLYHLIIGETLPENHQCPKFDFEGEDSVEKFIRSL